MDKRNKELREDLVDIAEADKRKNEPTITYEQLLEELRQEDKL